MTILFWFVLGILNELDLSIYAISYKTRYLINCSKSIRFYGL